MIYFNRRNDPVFTGYSLTATCATLSVPAWTNNGLVSLNDLSLRDPLASREMNEARQLMEAYVGRISRSNQERLSIALRIID